MKPSLLQAVKPLNIANLLDLQMCMFKLTMKMKAPKAMVEPFDTNLMTKLWVTININTLFNQRLNEYLKLFDIMVVVVLGYVKDEQTFSTLPFMKAKLQNKLGLHLDTIVHMFALEFYTQNNFLYYELITTWKDQKVRTGATTQQVLFFSQHKTQVFMFLQSRQV
jgi:hypothetical protein